MRVLLLVLLASTAQATTYGISEAHLASGYGCPTGSLDCAASSDMTLFGGGELIGELDFDAGLGRAFVSLCMSTPSSSFLPDTGPGVVFSGFIYQADIPVTFGSASFAQSGPSMGGMWATGTSLVAAVTGFACTLAGGGVEHPIMALSAQCSVTFGPQGFRYQDHDWSQTFHFSAVPEPGPAVLAGLVCALVMICIAARHGVSRPGMARLPTREPSEERTDPGRNHVEESR